MDFPLIGIVSLNPHNSGKHISVNIKLTFIIWGHMLHGKRMKTVGGDQSEIRWPRKSVPWEKSGRYTSQDTHETPTKRKHTPPAAEPGGEPGDKRWVINEEALERAQVRDGEPQTGAAL